MTCFYQVVKCSNPNNKKHLGEYGIIATAVNHGRTVEISSAYHMCFDAKKITRLADLCNRLELDPIHLADVVEDFITEL